MKTERKYKTLYLLFKIGGIVISCLFPIWAICDKFPLWAENHGAGRSIGVGAILILIVLTIIFRKSVFSFLKEKLKLNHAPPLAVWLIMLIASYIMIFIGNFLLDLTTVLWMGLVGCALGTLLTFIGENFFGEENKNE